MSDAVTGCPSGVFHGSVTLIGSHWVMCSATAKATESGKGTSRTFPPFGGANTSFALTIFT
ncbi:hypothetical protein [Streptomyces sp. NPDC006879]|uniref:hypothetical protein n=1 Tax=Streptomyces sp. NPDC006879 TaxID=3364767 RepID=UPI00367D0170